MNKINYIIFFIIINLSCASAKDVSLRNGDIIFQESMSVQSTALKLATKSRYTHVGIIYKLKNKIYVFEAVQPVKYTPFAKWIKRGKNSHYVVKRLKKSKEILTRQNIKRMIKIGKKFINKNYDKYFEWSDRRIYCSELVWKIYKRVLNIEIGELQKLKDFDLSSPIVKKIMKERYGRNIPLNEKVISPISMFNSNLLETVVAN